MRKKIGIPAWKTGPNSFGVGIRYIQYIERFGEPVILMPEHELNEDLDLIVLSGGADVDSSRYGEVPHYSNGQPNIFLENFDKKYLDQYIEIGVPVFGICRGHQSLAAHFGLNLIQDMYHETNPSNDPYKEMHKVVLKANLPNLMIGGIGLGKMDVNSRHHQVVHYEENNELLEIMVHVGTGENEMLAHKELPIASVQWHPEDVFNAKSTKFIDSVILHLLNEGTSILAPNED